MKKTKKLVLAALMTAFTFVATLISVGPLPPTNGYIHLGDALVLLSGILLGPLYGGTAAGIGSALADLSLGYGGYAPATFIIKFLVALSAGFMYKLCKASNLKLIISLLISEIIMVFGYYLYESFLLGGGIGALGALAAVPPNIFQGVSGVVIAFLTVNMFKNNNTLKKFIE